MDSASLRSLTPLLDGIDRWVELAPLLPVIVSLELVLSADNAVALASITKKLNNLELQKKALNIGIFIALLLRILVILTAQFFLNFWPVKLLGGLYLISLAILALQITFELQVKLLEVNRKSKILYLCHSIKNILD